MQAPSGQMTAPALQALLRDGTLAGEWVLDGEAEIKQRKTDFRLVIGDEKDKDGKSTKTVVRLALGGVR